MTGRHAEVPATLGDLFDLMDLDAAIDAGYVRRQHHPDLPLAILNYSELCQFERVWNPVTRQCRGLVYDTRDDRIVARPFPKFFNHGETGAPVDWNLDEPVVVTDKLDGSLGILYDDGGGGAIATRGSFTSEQAQHATKIWKSCYATRNPLPVFHSLLFEIIYPANRIVCDYGDLDDLVLLGAVDRTTGKSSTAADWPEWTGPSADQFSYRTLAEALAAEPRPGKEGLVVHFTRSDQRIKLKQEDYVALHRIITGCTARRLWEHLAVHACLPHAGSGIEFLVRRLMMAPDRIAEIQASGPDWLDRFVRDVPEEFREWVLTRVAEIGKGIENQRGVLVAEFEQAQQRADGDRKAFALLVKDRPHSGALFSLLQGREIDSYLWREARPEHELPYRRVDEAVT